MKLAFSTLGCPNWTWGEITSTAKDLGYDGVEVRGILADVFVPHAAPFAEGLSKTLQELARMGLAIPCLTSACDLFNPARHDQNIAEGRQYIQLAQQLKTPYIRVLGDADPQPSQQVDRDMLIATALELAPVAQQAGVMLLVESNGQFADTQALADLLSHINHPAVGALWDIHHPVRFFNERPADSYARLAPWLKHVHVKDSVLVDGKVQYKLLGSGDIPIAECVQVLRENGFEGYCALEWVKRWDLTLPEPGIVFPQYISYMRRLLA